GVSMTQTKARLQTISHLTASMHTRLPKSCGRQRAFIALLPHSAVRKFSCLPSQTTIADLAFFLNVAEWMN
ncbi:MAG: hypothetical protein AAGK05_19590, partial [Pseudomonadota bacterium]